MFLAICTALYYQTTASCIQLILQTMLLSITKDAIQEFTLNMERLYKLRLRVSACQSQFPTGTTGVHLIALLIRQEAIKAGSKFEHFRKSLLYSSSTVNNLFLAL